MGRRCVSETSLALPGEYPTLSPKWRVLPNVRFVGETLDQPIYFEDMTLRRALEGFAKKRVAPVFGKTLPAPAAAMPVSCWAASS
jgi:hypothetical protein